MTSNDSRAWSSIARSATILFLNCALLLPIQAAFTLDTTFNGSGKATVDFPNPSSNYTSQALRVFVQPNGRILLGGSFTNGTADGQLTGVAWAGLTPGGALDPNFASGGKVTEWASNGSSNLVDALMYPDGAFLHIAQFFRLPVGSSTVYASRYAANGGGDSVFATNASIGPCCLGFFNARPIQIAVRSDGKVLALITDEGQLHLYRLNPDGTRDTTFGNNGIVGLPFNRFFGSTFVEMIAMSDGKLLVVGHVAPFNNGSSELFLARYTETGNWDKTFGRIGTVRVEFAPGMTGRVRKAVLQPDGKILLSGNVVGWDQDVWIARFRSNGRRDETFGNNGFVIHDFAPGDTDTANSIAVGPDGKIRIAGQIGQTATPRFLVARFSTAGTLEDHTSIEFTAGQPAAANDLVLQPGGKVVVAGFTRNPNTATIGTAMAVARLVE